MIDNNRTNKNKIICMLSLYSHGNFHDHDSSNTICYATEYVCYTYPKCDTSFAISIVSFIKIFRVGSGLNFFKKSGRVGSGLKLVGFHRVGFGNRLSRVGSGSKLAIPAHLSTDHYQPNLCSSLDFCSEYYIAGDDYNTGDIINR